MTVPQVPAPAPRRNGLGISALVLVLAAIALPVILAIVGFVATALGPQQTPDTLGWGVLGGLVIAALGLGIAGPVALVGIVLAIIALVRKNRGKIAAILALVLGAPLALVGLFVLPTMLDQLF
ncbi:MAG: hypothetical protein BGO97_12040 [Micrococcales bacterium 70-64]|nr:MAG: hypothetical protein ABT06_12040 [Leifsonia sp. SCN 70-46]OJX86383.1 MAG: hypothetical protein BGO97_12040 [Micrococcales bacterium 70-64]